VLKEAEAISWCLASSTATTVVPGCGRCRWCSGISCNGRRTRVLGEDTARQRDGKSRQHNGEEFFHFVNSLD
jgi:hypothetical protein